MDKKLNDDVKNIGYEYIEWDSLAHWDVVKKWASKKTHGCNNYH